MNILIENETDLSFEEVGKIVDEIVEAQKNQTQYYGRWNGYETFSGYKIETLLNKRYLRFYIYKKECNKND